MKYEDEPISTIQGSGSRQHLEYAKNELKHRKPIKALGHLVNALIAYFRK